MKLSLKIIIVVLAGIILGLSATNFLILPLTVNFSEAIRILFILCLAVIPSTLIVLLVLKKLVINPIDSLNSVAKTIATGDLSRRIGIKSTDEIGELAQNFNTVINNLTSGMQNMANSLRDEKLKEKELAANYLELDRERAKDEALMTSIGDAVIAIDNQQRIILLNDAAGKMIGINPTAAVGQPYLTILKLMNEKDYTPAADFISMALQGEKLISGSRIILQKTDGNMMPVLYTSSPIFEGNKRVTGVVVVLKDITKERELEKMKDEFVFLASHELRTPMTAIKGLISMIFEGDYGSVNEQLKDPLSDIAQSTERLIQLVNDMLDVSRIESGRIKYAITEVSIPDVANEIVETLKPLSSQKNIKLAVSQSPINKVRADVDKVKQILINLVSNALKFTDQGGITISFRPYGKFAYISVTDTGIGISKENQEKLFGKFSQISTSQMGRPLGTGLGLYLSREFTRGLGGNMWIEHSEPGKGTTFTFALPLVSSML
ncbi:hypothetical protein A2867_05430 [Candidatus Daviesbacteria bacterium RIFCSPHIGHO2_01_FULL_40_11]|uniref:histidine kinase n=1 Tax=Candidatus Daviesbacteria bacterium RIFCSPHIGHO2_01_FULL_40_11 TaxID=1797762 RepID=A0A1F5JKX3_9BACT|nr:MAG: hypothetical protein A2867_05430 [Candidatus Daviesbacteria bacterium RIFCSPHIGHO2_01_FULL_40_11]